MATQVQFRRGSTVEHATFTGANGEVTVDTDKKVAVIHDATTAGGLALLREDGTNASFSLGSLTSCALKFANDPNTGLISPSSDNISIVTGGVARLTIDGSGSLSIPGNVSITGNLTVGGLFDSDDNLALIVALS
tara:strand:- start:124 stop:528 length:405 start_codon:yes stop_codon:yes gene_type:complete